MKYLLISIMALIQFSCATIKPQVDPIEENYITTIDLLYNVATFYIDMYNLRNNNDKLGLHLYNKFYNTFNIFKEVSNDYNIYMIKKTQAEILENQSKANFNYAIQGAISNLNTINNTIKIESIQKNVNYLQRHQ